MHISDWSSNVCSSDRDVRADRLAHRGDALDVSFDVEAAVLHLDAGVDQIDIPLHLVHDLERRLALLVIAAAAVAEDGLVLGAQQLPDGHAERLALDVPHGDVDAGDGRQDLRALAAAEMRRSEEHTSELQSLMRISSAVFCLKKKKQHTKLTPATNYRTNIRKSIKN